MQTRRRWSHNIARLGQKLEWCGYLTVKKIEHNVYSRFDEIHERDEQTDRRTTHDGISRAYSIARQKLILSSNFHSRRTVALNCAIKVAKWQHHAIWRGTRINAPVINCSIYLGIGLLYNGTSFKSSTDFD